MNEFDPKKIEELLDAKKTEEAKLYLEGFMKRSMTDEERAEIHVDFAILYVKVMNAVKEARNDALRGILNDLRLINSAEKELTEKAKLSEVRSKLSKPKK